MSKYAQFFTKNKSIIVTLFIFFLFTLGINLQINFQQQYLQQTYAWLEGKLYTEKMWPNTTDVDQVQIGNRNYWPLPPFPSVLLIPQALIGKTLHITLYQGTLNLFIIPLIFFIAYKLARLYNFSQKNALLISFALLFASNFIEIAIDSASWYLAHSIAFLLLLLALFEHKQRNRAWVIGICQALLLATRPTAVLSTIFFILQNLLSNDPFKKKLLNTFQLIIPIIFVGIALLYYNFVRFGNIMDSGYSKSIMYANTNSHPEERRTQGLFRIEYIPQNFYYYFLRLPHLNPSNIFFVRRDGEGISFFLVSPLFLWVFRKKPSTPLAISLWTASLVTLAVLLSYYHYGGEQLSARYMLDFLPLWYILLLLALNNNINKYQYILIILSATLNLYLFSSAYL